MTNYEKIKNMSIDETANFIVDNDLLCSTCAFFDEKGNCRCSIGLMCVDGIKKWLESEAVEN